MLRIGGNSRRGRTVRGRLKVRDCHSTVRRAASVALIAVVCAAAMAQTRHRMVKGNPDGAGGIPYTGGPASPSGIIVQYLLTLGLVVDLDRVAIPHTPVVVLSKDAVVVAECITDDQGMFKLSLPVTGGMTVALPSNGVDGVPIEAGQSLLIVVP